MLTATDEDILAAWIDGRTMLVSDSFDEALGDGECVALDRVAPKVCGMLGRYRLTAESFGTYVEDAVPLNDVGRQAPCETPPR